MEVPAVWAPYRSATVVRAPLPPRPSHFSYPGHRTNTPVSDSHRLWDSTDSYGPTVYSFSWPYGTYNASTGVVTGVAGSSTVANNAIQFTLASAFNSATTLLRDPHGSFCVGGNSGKI